MWAALEGCAWAFIAPESAIAVRLETSSSFMILLLPGSDTGDARAEVGGPGPDALHIPEYARPCIWATLVPPCECSKWLWAWRSCSRLPRPRAAPGPPTHARDTVAPRPARRR